VVTHAPPRHIHDREDLCHRGFRCFRGLIEKYKPRYFIHGHIHMNFPDPSHRITEINNTKIINGFGCYMFDIEKNEMD